jgi:hypothetical protein
VRTNANEFLSLGSAKIGENHLKFTPKLFFLARVAYGHFRNGRMSCDTGQAFCESRQIKLDKPISTV